MNHEQKMSRGSMSEYRKVFAYALIVAGALLVITPERLFADEQSHRKLAGEYMALTDTEKMMTGVFEQVKKQQLEELEKVEYPGKTAENDKELKKRVADYLDMKLSWNDFKEGYTDIYAEVFTEEEHKALVTFYSSPVGKKLMSTAQEVRLKLLKSTQAQLTDMIFKINKIKQDFVLEQEKRKE